MRSAAEKKARHAAIANYAAEMAGSEFDIDVELEAAWIECLNAISDRVSTSLPGLAG